MIAAPSIPTAIDPLVEDVESWDPSSAPDSDFTYIDIASIDAASKQITASKRIRGADAPSRARQLVRVGDVLVSTVRPNLNAVAHVPAELDGATASTGFCVLRANSERLNGRYLFHWVRSPVFIRSMIRLATGASYPAISDRIVRDSTIPLPPLAEQKRIAAILDTADAIRRKRREANQCVSDLAPSIFYRLFAQWLQKPISEMPRLGSRDLADIASGATKGRRFNGQPTVIVPYIRVANVQDGFLDLAEIKTIEALPSDVEELRLHRGDVLMTEGGDFDKLGRGAMWEEDIPDCIHQNHVFRVRCNRKNLLPIYFAHFIRTQLAKGYFLSCAKKTSNLASMNLTQLKDTPVPCPPIALQERFGAEMQTLNSLRDAQSTAIAASDDMFAGLVQRAFKGEL